MAMGIVTDSDFAEELGKLSGPKAPELDISQSKKEPIPFPHKGRPEGKQDVPPVIRALIAEEALCGISVPEIIKSYNTSASAISAYKHDATSTASYHSPNSHLQRNNNKLRDEVSSTARGRLMSALAALDDQKIAEAKPIDISAIARNMSTIMKNMEPPNQIQNNIQQAIVYQPRVKEEDEFEVIEVNE